MADPDTHNAVVRFIRSESFGQALVRAAPFLLVVVAVVFSAIEAGVYGQREGSVSRWLVFGLLMVLPIWHLVLVFSARPWWLYVLFAGVHLPIAAFALFFCLGITTTM